MVKGLTRLLPAFSRLERDRDAALERTHAAEAELASRGDRERQAALRETELRAQLASAQAEADHARAVLEAQAADAGALAAAELTFDLDAIKAAAVGRGRYKSCDWIEDSVFLSDRDVNLCCMQSVGNGSPRLFGLDEEIPSYERIGRAKEQVRVANQTSRAPCDGCYVLKERDWEAKDYLGTLAIAGFLHCNLSCSYCVTYNFDPKDRGGDALKLVQTYLDQGVLRPGQSRIEWGGGESTFHKDFDAVARLAAEHSIQMAVYTNATGYCVALEDGLRRGLNNVIISIDAGTDDTYERIKGRRFMQRVWTNVGRYLALNPGGVTVKYIVMEANSGIGDLDAFLARAEALGVRRLAVSVDVHNNTASQGRLSENVLHATAYLLQRARGRGMMSWVAETLSPESQRRVESLSAELEQRPEAPLQLLHNAPRPLEIAYTSGPIFARRVAVALKADDDFNVVCPQPIVPELAHPNLLALVAAWAARGLGHNPTDPQSEHLIRRALSATSDGRVELDERLAGIAEYRLAFHFTDAGLFGLSFRRAEPEARALAA